LREGVERFDQSTMDIGMGGADFVQFEGAASRVPKTTMDKIAARTAHLMVPVKPHRSPGSHIG